jgi:hypothetical protein
VGLGLVDFVPQQDGTWLTEPPGPLRAFEQRLWVSWQHEWPYPVPEAMRARGRNSILLNHRAGQQQYELPEFLQERPCLALYGDEGSKFLSCVPFLQHRLKARVVWLRDPAHRQWNDFRNAVKHAGFRPLFYEVCLGLNMRQGPWLSCSFFQQLRGGMEEPRASPQSLLTREFPLPAVPGIPSGTGAAGSGSRASASPLPALPEIPGGTGGAGSGGQGPTPLHAVPGLRPETGGAGSREKGRSPLAAVPGVLVGTGWAGRGDRAAAPRPASRERHCG